MPKAKLDSVNSEKPWVPPKWKKPDVAALQALLRGEATPDQQIRAINYIVVALCGVNEMSFRAGPDGERETAFAEGRRFVGHRITTMTKIPLSKIKEEKSK